MKKNVTFQLDEKDIEILKKIADADNRSVASYIRNLVIDLIKKYEERKC